MPTGSEILQQLPESPGLEADGSSPVAVAVFVDPEDMDISRSAIAGGRLGAPVAKSVIQAVLDR
ncbi:hypothetical protein ACTWQF_08190 [Streptomyces sp. 8N114]|uniref:hypothetical protein n=1 Tax=Streptomyces sp. 8N114 TaxID=3457419 RepID=UPI003FD4ADC2